jgi:hypothetical protein
VTLPYYLQVHRKRAAAVRLLARSGAARFVFPSIYFVARK